MISYLGEKFIDLIIKIFGDEIAERINKRFILGAWYKSFEKAVEFADEMATGFGKELASHRTMMRFFHETFDYKKSGLYLDDLAVSIAMEFLDFGVNISSDNIICFAEAIADNWNIEVHSNKYIRSKLKEIDKSIEIIKFSNIDELRNILNNTEQIRQTFFKTYEQNNGIKTIRIWYPAPNEDWIRWDQRYCIDIKLNPIQGMNLGFFRLGYDYSLIEEDRTYQLKYASISSSKEREAGQFKSTNFIVGENSGNIFWAR